MKKILNCATKVFLIISLLSGCAGIKGGKVRLEDYPEIDHSNLKNLDLSYEKVDFEPKRQGKDFNNNIVAGLLPAAKGKKAKESSSGCHVKIASNNDYGTSKICQTYGIVAGLTMFIIPAYCYWKYEAKATLISTKTNQVLKEYYLKDKVHEVWSFFFLVTMLPGLKEPDDPKHSMQQIEQTVSEALSRQILNDASKFKECRKK